MLPLTGALLLAATAAAAQEDPLPSWNNGATKAAIVDFVTATTDPGSPDFVAVEDRVATFDNDGNLWAEQPAYFQLLFAFDRAAELAAADPGWATTPALKAAAAGDVETLVQGGKAALLQLVGATHSGVTVEAFTEAAAEWLDTAVHPETGLRYKDMVYQPMLELLDYLRANDFTTYIVSGGGIDFIRAYAEGTYGIPPEQVIGSQGDAHFEIVDGVPQVIKDPDLFFIDDKGGKPVGIVRHIGRRPIFASGNSDGDLAMLQWTKAGEGPRFGLLLHHTDGEREWAYDRDSHVGRLDEALDLAPESGIVVVDMAADWARIYPED
jgi:phosphoglycolate phosphatase-like HAD superfamily hydrolase